MLIRFIKYLILVLIIISPTVHAQYGWSIDADWESEWDTTVVYKGNKILSFTPHIKYTHSWVYKKTTLSFSFCAVLHDSRGCPDGWGVEERICSVCLRKEILKERRIIIPVRPDPYLSLEKELKKLIK